MKIEKLEKPNRQGFWKARHISGEVKHFPVLSTNGLIEAWWKGEWRTADFMNLSGWTEWERIH